MSYFQKRENMCKNILLLSCALTGIAGAAFPARAACAVPNGLYVGVASGIGNVPAPTGGGNYTNLVSAAWTVNFTGNVTVGTITGGAITNNVKLMSLPTDPNGALDTSATPLRPFAPGGGVSSGFRIYAGAIAFGAQTVSTGSPPATGPVVNTFYKGTCTGVLASTSTNSSSYITPLGSAKATAGTGTATSQWIYTVTNSGAVVTITNAGNDYNMPGLTLRLEHP
ncbi:hypothetical protein WOA01_19205 [Methylocystis sp. IM2]|uniref:hypothetical protein n=1 Tax=Methylocystis sp. IM2 TaxID=3136563 RepID=UPI0030F964CC